MTAMNLQCQWKNKMSFDVVADSHKFSMDANTPIGDNTSANPKQLLLAAICGCTGMDVVALMKKYKQPLESFKIDADAPLTKGKHPAVFEKVDLIFAATGAGIEASKLLEAIKLSQTQFCGVSAMVSKVVPIFYKVTLNGEEVGSGKGDFDI